MVRVNTEIIDHSTDPQEFINTVGETYNKLVSQSGGYEEEELYKQKYLKYKQKYTELKAQIGGTKYSISIKFQDHADTTYSGYLNYWHIFIIDNNKQPGIYSFDENEMMGKWGEKSTNTVCYVTTKNNFLVWPDGSSSEDERKMSWSENVSYREENKQKFIGFIEEARKRINNLHHQISLVNKEVINLD